MTKVLVVGLIPLESGVSKNIKILAFLQGIHVNLLYPGYFSVINKIRVTVSLQTYKATPLIFSNLSNFVKIAGTDKKENSPLGLDSFWKVPSCQKRS